MSEDLPDIPFLDLCDMIAKSGMFPRSFDSKEKVAVAIMFGQELGISRLQSLQGLHVVNGKVGLGGDLAKALCNAQPDCEGIVDETLYNEKQELDAVAVKVLRGTKTVVRSFSVDDARRAKLWGREGPWTQYPERMLYYRALGFALRDAYPHVLKGIKTSEELADEPILDLLPTTQQHALIQNPVQAQIQIPPAPEPQARQAEGDRELQPHPVHLEPAQQSEAPATRRRSRVKLADPPPPTQEQTNASDAPPSPEAEMFAGETSPLGTDLISAEVQLLCGDIRERLKTIGSNEYRLIQQLILFKFKDGDKLITNEVGSIDKLQLKSLQLIAKYWDGLAKALKALNA